MQRLSASSARVFPGRENRNPWISCLIECSYLPIEIIAVRRCETVKYASRGGHKYEPLCLGHIVEATSSLQIIVSSL